MRARENVAVHSRGDIFTQILRRARKNVAVYSGGDMFTQFLREHGKLLHSLVESMFSPSFYESM